MIKINDRWFRLAIIAISFLAAIFLNEWLERPRDWLLVQRVILSFLTIFLICEGNRFIIFYSRNKFRGKNAIINRLLVIIPAGILFTAFLLVLNAIVRHYFAHKEWKLTADNDAHVFINGRQVTIGIFGSSIFKGFLIFFAFLIVYEIFYYFARLRKTEREKERLQMEMLQTELNSLKQKVNPHFLFNSLNSLSSLISENPAQAEIFLDEMTKVYRYLLRNNEVELASLETELKFIRSYVHLLKTRYGDSVDFIIEVQQRHMCFLIPPLTLQLLVENAVKHNKLLKDQPLVVHLFSNDKNQLIVRNNIQKKDTAVDSTKIGLQNIATKYKLLNQPDIIVEENDVYFSVVIPLIKN